MDINTIGLRYLMISLCIFQIFLLWYSYGLRHLIQFFTIWTLWVTAINIALSIKCSLDIKIEMKKSWLAWHHITFELAMPMNIITVVVYWSTIHAKRIREPDMVDPIRKFSVYFAHIMPIVVNWLNFYLTDVTIKAKHSIVVFPLGIIYTYINYRETKHRGRPIYPWATWEDVP